MATEDQFDTIRMSDLMDSKADIPAQEEQFERVRLGDLMSMQREPDVEYRDPILEITDEDREVMARKGKIGFAEQWERTKKSKMIPFNPEGAFEATDLWMASQRLRDHRFNHVPEQREQDEELVSEFLRRQEEERVRGFTIGGQFVRGVTVLPAFMIEFLATGSLAAIAKRGVTKGAQEVSKKAVKESVLKMTTRRVSNAIGVTTFRTAAMPHRVIEGLGERQVNAGLELTENGITMMDEVNEKPAVSAMKAFGDVFIENLSEVSGPAITKIVVKPAQKIGAKFLPKPITNGLEALWLKMRPGESVRNLWTKAGYNGFLEELGEERLGDFLRAVTGVEDFGVDVDTPTQMVDRIWATIPNSEELLVESLVLSVPGGLRMGTGAMVDMIQKRKNANPEHREPEIREITPEEVDQIIQEKPKAEEPTPEEAPVEEPPVQEVTPEEVAPEGPAAPEVTEEGDVSFEPAELEISPEDIEAARRVLSEGTEGVQLSEAQIREEARRIRQEIIESQPISPLEQLVQDSGGIRQFKKDPETGKVPFQEEFRGVPRRFRNSRGLPPDELAEAAVLAGIVPEGTTGPELISMLSGLGERPKTPSLADLREQAVEQGRARRAGFARVQPGIKAEIRRVTGQIPTELPTITKFQALKEGLRLQARVARETQRLTRRDIAQAQGSLITLLEQSDLEPKDRAKFIRTIKNVRSREQLVERLDEITDRIKRLSTASTRRNILTKLKKALKSTKVRKQSGKPVGKFTPEIQQALDTMVMAAQMSSEQAEAKIAENLSRYENGIMPDEIVRENKIIQFMGGLSDKENEELADVLTLVEDTIAEGRILNKALKLDRKERINNSITQFNDEITGGRGVQEGAGTFGVVDKSRETDTLKSIKEEIVSGLRDLIFGWNDITNIISAKSGKKSGQSFIEQFSDVFNETRAEEEAIGNFNEKLAGAVRNAYGVETDAEAVDILAEGNRPVDLGVFTNKAGVTDNLVMTKAQARKKWMEMQDPSLNETFEAEQGMAYTPEIRAAIENFLSAEDKAFAREQLKIYREFYPRINAVYGEMYGVNLPFNEFYSPIKREDIDSEISGGFGEFIQEVSRRLSVTSGSLKSRVRNIKPLSLSSDIEVLQQHISEMERFINWAEKIKDLNAVYGASAVKSAIKQEYGNNMNKTIFGFLQDFTRGGVDWGKRNKLIDEWRIRTTQVKLAVRPAILIKQLSSTPAFLEVLTVKEFVDGVADFWRAPLINYKILRQSGFLRFRGQNIERDIKAASKTDAFKAFRKKDSFINRLMLNVQIGDQGAIVMGGWGVYKKAIAEGKTHKEALEEFARVANAAQQSADLAEQSNFQRGGSLAKLFTMFATTPNQYLRKELAAIRNFRNGRMSGEQAAKQFFIFHMMLPMIFQWISDFGEIRPKELLRAAIFGNLNGLFILGDMIDALLRKAMGMQVFPQGIPILSVPLDDINRALFSIEWDNITDEDVWRAVQGALGTAGFATRIPLKEISDMIASLGKIYDGNYRQGIGGALGWSKTALGADESGGPF